MHAHAIAPPGVIRTSGHTIILDISDPEEQRILDGFLAEMRTKDEVDLSVHGDRVTLRLGH